MKCEHKDCFTCPYEDCIADAKELPKEAPSQGSEYHKTWYEAHKEHVKEYQKKILQRTQNQVFGTAETIPRTAQRGATRIRKEALSAEP